jgi:hypothetical protein
MSAIMTAEKPIDNVDPHAGQAKMWIADKLVDLGQTYTLR